MSRHFYPIRLRREGDFAVVDIDTGVKDAEGNTFIELIRERLDGAFSHIIEPSGIDRAIVAHYGNVRDRMAKQERD